MSATLTVLTGKHAGRVIDLLPKARLIIGRAEDCHLRLRTELISRHHAAIEFCDPDWIVRDLGSSNGTFLNGERVLGPATMVAGDRLTVGPMEFQIGVKSEPEPQRDPESVFESSVAGWLADGDASSSGDTVILSQDQTASFKDLAGDRPQQAPPVAPQPSCRQAAMDALDSLRKMRRDK